MITAVSIQFKKDLYRINEKNKRLNVMLNLSNPSSTNIKLKVNTNDVTATGKSSPVMLLLFYYCNHIMV